MTRDLSAPGILVLADGSSVFGQRGLHGMLTCRTAWGPQPSLQHETFPPRDFRSSHITDRAALTEAHSSVHAGDMMQSHTSVACASGRPMACDSDGSTGRRAVLSGAPFLCAESAWTD